jgi:RsiW-degrading membrane proteinase PrsW (M82 family)
MSELGNLSVFVFITTSSLDFLEGSFVSSAFLLFGFRKTIPWSILKFEEIDYWFNFNQLQMFDTVDLNDDEETVTIVKKDAFPQRKQQTGDLYDDSQIATIIEFDHQKFFGVCFISLLSALLIMLLIGFITHPVLGILCIFAIAPAVVILGLIIRFKRKKISTELTFELFWSGLLITIVVVVVEILVTVFFTMVAASVGFIQQKEGGKPYEFNFNFVFHVVFATFDAFVVAGFVEESAKYILIHRVRDREEFNSPEACIIYAIAGSLGFATLENISYVVFSSIRDPVNSFLASAGIAAGRSVLSVPLHCITGAIVGINFAKMKFFDEKLSFWEIMFLPIFIHGLYDFVLMVSIPFLSIVFVSFLICILIVVVSATYAFKEFVKIQRGWMTKPNPDILVQSDDDNLLIDFREPNAAIF